MKIYVVETNLDCPTPIRSLIVCIIGFEDITNFKIDGVGVEIVCFEADFNIILI